MSVHYVSGQRFDCLSQVFQPCFPASEPANGLSTMSALSCRAWYVVYECMDEVVYGCVLHECSQIAPGVGMCLLTFLYKPLLYI